MDWKLPISREALTYKYHTHAIAVDTHNPTYSYQICCNADNKGKLRCYFLLVPLIINIDCIRINRKSIKNII